MPELIDREKLLHELCGMCCAGEKYKCRNPWGECDEATLIKKQPTIEAEPVLHGSWHYNLPNAIFVCSECKMMYRDNPKFCPRCGAKMDGGAEQ